MNKKDLLIGLFVGTAILVADRRRLLLEKDFHEKEKNQALMSLIE